jgi:tRNA1Val (adenine37-N6)-methyltransferase
MFYFKQFVIDDEQSPMKVGIDSVMLGSWIQAENAQVSLDLGSGCGILSLMVQQRFPDLQIVGVEIHQGAYLDSLKNLANFPLPHNIQFRNLDFYDVKKRCYDLIFTNPPFFSESIKAPDKGRSVSRHMEDFELRKLLASVSELLSSQGEFQLIFDYKRLDVLDKYCMEFGLYIKKQVVIFPSPAHQAKRVLLSYSKSDCKPDYDKLIIRDNKGNYTNMFKELTQDFYLRFS